MQVRRRIARSSQASASRAARSGWRHAGLAAAGAAIVLAGLTGCAKMDAALTRQWMVVIFSPHANNNDVLQVRAACSHIQNTPPLPLPTSTQPVYRISGLRFNTTDSTPANLAELQVCLQKFKLVLGVNAQDAGSQGG